MVAGRGGGEGGGGYGTFVPPPYKDVKISQLWEAINFKALFPVSSNVNGYSGAYYSLSKV